MDNFIEGPDASDGEGSTGKRLGGQVHFLGLLRSYLLFLVLQNKFPPLVNKNKVCWAQDTLFLCWRFQHYIKRIWENILKSHLERNPPPFFLLLSSYSKEIKNPRGREPEDNNENN